MSLSIKRAVALAVVATLASAAIASVSSAATIYTETNSARGNAIQVYRTSGDGSLALEANVNTGGLGTDTGLGNQGALALSKSGRWLFAVNAGSNEISSFAITNRGLQLVGKVSSGGTRPISVTVDEDRLYVLNAGDSGNITGFYVSSTGRLQPIPQSTRALSSSARRARPSRVRQGRRYAGGD